MQESCEGCEPNTLDLVMPGLVPGIHVLVSVRGEVEFYESFVIQ